MAANLALALVNKNRRVLLIDGDLRKPALNKIFDKTVTQEMEFGNYLLGKYPLQNVLTRDKETGLYYLFGTKPYRNSDVLLSSQAMKDMFKTAKKAVDYIIIDSSPTSITSDAEIIAEYADAVLLTVRQCTSRTADINDTLDTLKKCNVEVYGCVLNAIQTKFMPKSVEYGYSYGYGYGGKYGKYGRYGNYGRKKKTANDAAHKKTEK